MSKARDIADSTETLDVDGGTIKLDGNYPVGTANVALGDTALDYGSLSGNYNTALGSGTLTLNTTASFNTATGSSALGANTTGSLNTALGADALRNNTTASNNTAVGYRALYSGTSGLSGTVALGYEAGYSNNANYGCFVGLQAGYSSTGANNTFVGAANSGYYMTTGSKNTILGAYDGNQGGLDIRTSSNNIVLSDGDGNPRMWFSGSNLFVHAVPSSTQAGARLENPQIYPTWTTSTGSYTGSHDHYIFINGNGQVGSITTSGSATAYNTSSDYRLKTDAQPMTGASARVQALKPVNFEWIADGTRVDGFLAHEAQEVVPEAVIGTKDSMRDEEYEVTPAVLDDDGNVVTEAVMGTRSVPDYQGIDQSKLVPLLTAALQEALTKIDDMEARLAALEAV